VTNIDGMEWRRTKFGPAARATLRILEWFAVRFSHRVIADNAALVPIARAIHGNEPLLIAYGGDHTLVEPAARRVLPGYFLSIARIEPENNCHLILEAFAGSGQRLVFVGNWGASAYGRALKARYGEQPDLQLLEPIYAQPELAALRAGAVGYIHGHSVGGTNPSLVEALFHTDRVLAFDCAFNRSTLGGTGAYFDSAQSLRDRLVDLAAGRIGHTQLATLRDRYRWTRIVDEYLAAAAR
jgi:glycosyltransferase involved in cell wall biosynthesis